MKKKILSISLVLCILISCVAVAFNVSAVTTNTNDSQASTNAYGLMDYPQEGVILHAWNWSFNNIKAQMKTIAESGYTSVQVSPIQINKEATKGKPVGDWWVFYQPAGFTIDNTGTSALGVKSEFKAMCEEAHKYGVRVIVDVVANHLGNKTDWTNLCSLAYTYEPEIANNWLFHNEANCHDGSIWNVTRGQIGMPDLQTENSIVQQRVLSYCKELIDCGADGFRFDAAKHIETPDDGSYASQFWPTVINGSKTYYASKGYYDSLYCYGEILNVPGGGRSFSSYTKYMSVTDDSTGNGIRNAVAGGNASGAATSRYNSGCSADKVVLWAESHDTYSNSSKESTYVSDSNINKTWALVASKSNASALYFARPQGYNKGTLGNVESYQWCSKEVAEVNKFHNHFNGKSEYLASSGSIAYNERGTAGVVLVNCGGTSTSVSVPAHKMASGTYKDQITGNTFTVSNGQIKGQIGSTGIAVVYNAVKNPVASINPGSSSYKTDTLTLTLNYANATSAQYSIDGGAYQSFTSGQTITIGKGLPYDTKTTVSVKATNGTTTSDVVTYTYTKVDPAKTVKLYFDNSTYKWSNVYAYVYSDISGVENGVWPGVKMTYDSQTGLYYYDVPEELENGNVLFTESSTATTNRYPAENEPGLSIGGTSKIFKENKVWQDYVTETPTTEPTTTPTNPEDMILIGDVSVDGLINIKDATDVQSYVTQLLTITNNQLLAADVNCDGVVNIKDATSIQMYIALAGATSSNIGKYLGDVNKPVTPTEPDSTTYKVYFKNTANWSTPRIYYWDSSGGAMAWPGNAMKLVSGNIYCYDAPKTMTGVIFNNGSGTQTEDLAFPTQNNMMYDYSTKQWSKYA